jgi:hypothetical protein
MSFDNDREEKRTLPICFSLEQIAFLEEFAKKKGMTSFSQAVEYLAKQNTRQ